MSEAAPTPDNTIRAAQGSGLLATKLYARPARANLVARPRLTRLLDDGRSAGLILVSAPAGFGKTTLLAEWLRNRPQSACWLSLDAADNDPARFLSYVIAALQRVVPGVAGDLVGPLRSPEPPSAEAVVAALVNELALGSGRSYPCARRLPRHHVTRGQWRPDLPPGKPASQPPSGHLHPLRSTHTHRQAAIAGAGG